MIPFSYFLIIAALLFSSGLVMVLVRKNVIFVLMGIELMLNAAIINFISFGYHHPYQFLSGQIFSIFILVIAAVSIGVALVLTLNVFSYFQTNDLDQLSNLNE